MKTQKNGSLLASILMMIILFTSCRKKETESYENTLSDDSYASSTYDDVKTIADEAAKNGSVTSYKTDGTEETLAGPCANVTVDTANSLKTVTVDFGTSNCTCVDGRNRRGKIIITFTGKYRDQGTVITHTFDNYFVDDNQVMGTKKVTNIGNYTYTVEVNGTIIKANNGGTITWTSTRTRTWTQGYNTLLIGDDVYEVTGSSSGTNAQGKNFTKTILTPLVRKMAVGCRRNFVQGTMEIVVAGGRTRKVDYGDGTCDDLATVTIGNRTRTIILR